MSQLKGIIVDEIGAPIASALYSVEVKDVDGNAVTATVTKNSGSWTVTDLDFSKIYQVIITYQGKKRIVYCGSETQLNSLVIGLNTFAVGSDGVVHLSPATETAPLVLGANAQNHRVVGFDADSVDGRHADNSANNLVVLGADGLIPPTLYVAGSGDGGDANTLDGHDSTYFATADHTHPAGSATNADTVDNCHAGTGANNVLKLDSGGKIPGGNLPVQIGNIRILYGSVSVNAGSTIHVTFSAAFSSPPAVTLGDTNYEDAAPFVTNVSTTGFDLVKGGSVVGVNGVVFWIAIGPA
jgi:hypothetical protein